MPISTYENNELKPESKLGNFIEFLALFGPIIAFIVYLAINR